MGYGEERGEQDCMTQGSIALVTSILISGLLGLFLNIVYITIVLYLR